MRSHSKTVKTGTRIRSNKLFETECSRNQLFENQLFETSLPNAAPYTDALQVLLKQSLTLFARGIDGALRAGAGHRPDGTMRPHAFVVERDGIAVAHFAHAAWDDLPLKPWQSRWKSPLPACANAFRRPDEVPLHMARPAVPSSLATSLLFRQ
jgi:hypothetical protein